MAVTPLLRASAQSCLTRKESWAYIPGISNVLYNSEANHKCNKSYRRINQHFEQYDIYAALQPCSVGYATRIDFNAHGKGQAQYKQESLSTCRPYTGWRKKTGLVTFGFGI